MAKTAQRETATEVMPLVPAGKDGMEVAAAGAAITDFLKGVRTFFVRADALEIAAKSSLDAARLITLPVNGDEDLRLQAIIRQANEDRKILEEHWSITSKVHKLHRYLTSRRAVGVEALEEAANLGNRLHNTYVEGERRKVAAEEDRRRRAAEQEEREKRELDAAAAEAQAVALEESASELSDREEIFVKLVAQQSHTGQGAALAAGFKDPVKSAARLLTMAKIQNAIKALKEAAAIRQQAEARKAQPLHVEIAPVQADVQRAAGSHDRTTWSATCLDQAATVEAFRSGQYGIPGDLFMVNPAKANEYARSMHERVNRWPGMRATSETKVVG